MLRGVYTTGWQTATPQGGRLEVWERGRTCTVAAAARASRSPNYNRTLFTDIL